MGNNGAIIKTMNAGNTWSVETINTTEQLNFTHIKDGKAIITGSNGTLFTNPNIAVGIEKNKQNIKPMTLLPNPTEGILYIPSHGQQNQITVYNVPGEVLLQKTATKEIDLSGFEVGVYYLAVQLQDKSIEVRKVVKR